MQSIAIKIIANNLSEKIFGTRDSSSFSPIFGPRMMKSKKETKRMAVCLPNWMQIFNEHCQALPSYTGWKKLKAYLSREKVGEKMEKAWRREARPSSGQPDIQRFERVKERERDKLKSSFDEKLARHAASASNNRAPQEDSTEENCGEARPKHPLPKHPSSTGQNRRNPPLYKED